MQFSYNIKSRWSKSQVEFLEAHCYELSDEQLAAHLGRSLKATRRKRERLLLKKKSGRGIVAKYEAPTKTPPSETSGGETSSETPPTT